MNFDASIICRRTPYGMICDWDGPRAGVAKVYGEQVISLSRKSEMISGSLFDVGHLKLRVVQFPCFGSNGLGSDTAAVMLESPHAQLYWLYREHAERLVRLIFQIEARLKMAYCGLRLRPFPEGQVMPIAAKFADILL